MRVDWTGRAIAVVSLLVAGGTAAYVLMLQQDNGQNETALRSLDTKLAEIANKYEQSQADLAARYTASLERHDGRLEGWNTQLNDAVKAFQSDATSLLAKMEQDERQASENREVVFRQTLADLPVDAADDVNGVQRAVAEISQDDTSTALNPPANAAAGDAVSAGDAEASGTGNPFSDDELFDKQARVAGAELKLLNTVLKPGTGNTTLIELQNDGSEPALIARIRFRPESDFENQDPLDLDPKVVGDTVATIAYSPSDNTSLRPGFHGIYDRTLSQPIRVPAGEKATVRVVIESMEHEGWGFAGTLVLNYNDGERIVVPSARVAFRKI
jgi:hypothetical protein